MDTPLYTATVTSLTSGWTFSTTQGDVPDPDDLVQLLEPLEYRWGFDDNVIPGQLVPFTAAVHLAGRTLDDLPSCKIGDLLTILVRIGTAGPAIIAPYPMRVTEALAELNPADNQYAATLSIELVDRSVDWTGVAPGVAFSTLIGGLRFFARRLWRERFADLGARLGVSIGCPTFWSDTEGPVVPGGPAVTLTEIDPEYDGKAIEVVTRTVNAHHPNGWPHTACTIQAANHPAGYEYIGPPVWQGGYLPSSIPEPPGPLRVELVPASRKLPASVGLPLRLVVTDGLLTLAPIAPPAGDVANQIALDASWCEIPTTARRSRDSAFNVVQLFGYAGKWTPTAAADDNEYQYTRAAHTISNPTDIAARGRVVRDVQSDINLGVLNQASAFDYAAAATAAAQPFLSDPSVLDAGWTYDTFELTSSLIPQDVATWLLPMLAPRLPGELNGDNRLVRHVTIYDLDPWIRDQGQPVTGFIVEGAMRIEGGDIRWSLTTTPGRPQYTGGTPTPITVAELNGITPPGHTASAIDPTITVADLAYVGAGVVRNPVPATVTPNI